MEEPNATGSYQAKVSKIDVIKMCEDASARLDRALRAPDQREPHDD